jgi:hypothetical protein
VQPGWDGGNPKPAFDDVSQMFGDVEPLRQRRR